ncbi:PEP/pyruvate-binding domain-containing protein [Streptomyces caniscabiei]|uniref:PEP/pyruvate-binding domain-containing protein n=2 Tax=Streptomyces caniscabiei TaxID=2746961 RepID=UPI0029A33087|nr:PEP/pyruvate-binding domain-containing protein [Streptomyces caniscabiei]MDX2599347.1 PEP/pyruvate-binding domain-containing protein [Streptomyces caniscabiei]MDX2738272.1 PEP/pyruvate-binding domain-containing protein [Streptomyces caniscabiei]
MTTLDERHGEHGEGARGGAPPRSGRTPGSHVVPLHQPAASLPLLTGSKAAHLARAARAGLPVLPGFVIPYDPGDAGDAGDASDERREPGAPRDLSRAWAELSRNGSRSLVVRSSSPQEDTEESSLAGRFDSVLDVRGWEEFRAAVRTVLGSARQPDGDSAPMAVLVQPMLRARIGGVLFGADPVAGRTDRMLVSVVRGGPDTLVSGQRPGTSHWLSRWGRLLRTESSEAGSSGEVSAGADGSPTPGAPRAVGGGALLTGAEARRLARLARRAARVFGGPQDIEFAFDEDGRLWLLQSRPITAMGPRPPRGARLLGPGPVAETLPGQLEPLEEDLWVAPMDRGLACALDLGGSASRRRLRSAPVVTAVGGRAAADLRLLGAVPPRHPALAWLDPVPGARRLGAAWRVGRLTSTLPGLATDLVADVDRRLVETPSTGDLPTVELISTLRWTRSVLVSLHAQEALAGALLPEAHVTAAGTALATLTESRYRDRSLSGHQVVTAEPVVLALTAPSLWGELRLPPPEPVHHNGASATAAATTTPTTAASASPATTKATSPLRTTPLSPGALPPREALRLRIRWVQELQVRLVREAARRLLVRGVLGEARRVGLLRWKEFVTALETGGLPGDFEERLPRAVSAPLPDRFRLAEGGVVVAERAAGPSGAGGGTGGRGVSGGRGFGTVWDGVGTGPPEAVLVVRTLDPALAPLLPHLTGLVAQTGSPLSHLAVLAREFGVPTVVGVDDAVRRFPPGTRVTVDGGCGDVRAEGS